MAKAFGGLTQKELDALGRTFGIAVAALSTEIVVLAKEKGLSAKRFGTLIYKECVKKGVSFL